MGMGRRPRERQQEFWIPADSIHPPPQHVFYDKLNDLLGQHGFDAYVENLCEAYYTQGTGRPGIPPGVYFRMLLIGFFEGIQSQRGIAWRCSDSRSLQHFLGYTPCQATPDHSSLTRIRDRLPLSVHEAVFAWILSIAQASGLLKGKTVAVDSTLLEANAAMKSIVRTETGEDYQEYLTHLMHESGAIPEDQQPTAEQRRRFDQTRPDKRVSNQEWHSASDPESEITKLKDGRTHLAYKAEHVVDLDSEFLLAAQIYPATQPDSGTLIPSILIAQANLIRAGREQEIEEGVADKGYHKNQTLASSQAWGVRTYIPEPTSRYRRVWTDKPAEQRLAVLGNRRRMRGARGQRLNRKRSELAERSFAHVCQTGGARRTWLRGLLKVSKRYTIQSAGHNLSLILRKLLGVGKPRVLQGFSRAFLESFIGFLVGFSLWTVGTRVSRTHSSVSRSWALFCIVRIS